MNYNQVLTNYINLCPYDEPIFIEDIKEYFVNELKCDIRKIIKKIYVYINRLVKEKVILQFMKGVYYKPTKGIYGNKKLNVNKVISKKYIDDNRNLKGYISGAYVFNKLGLTTQMPRVITIVTNECPNKNDYYNEKLGVLIRKPKVEINKDNYLYLQLLDILLNKDDVPIEAENEREIIYKFIKDNNLDFEKIFEYANKIGNIKPIKKLYELGGKNE